MPRKFRYPSEDQEINIRNQRQAEKLHGVRAGYWAAVTGSLALILLAMALVADDLWTAEIETKTVRFGWQKVRGFDSDPKKLSYSDLEARYGVDGSTAQSRGQLWLTMGISSACALFLAIIGSAFHKFISRACVVTVVKIKFLIIAILYIVSAVLLFIGCAVVASYDGPTDAALIQKWKVSGSSWLGFFVMAIISISAVIILHFENFGGSLINL